jgi:hypothetical protein
MKYRPGGRGHQGTKQRFLQGKQIGWGLLAVKGEAPAKTWPPKAAMEKSSSCRSEGSQEGEMVPGGRLEGTPGRGEGGEQRLVGNAASTPGLKTNPVGHLPSVPWMESLKLHFKF